jgi:N-acetylmuramoyl-L-alanine amidase
VRIRRLLFFLAPILFGATTSLHAALGPTSVCLPPQTAQSAAETVGVSLPISELSPAIPYYDAEERDYLIRTIVFEATGEPEVGKAAVAFVVVNRERSGRWGDNIGEVVTQPWQFEPWMTKRRQIERLSRDDPRYQSAARIADIVLSGQMPDPTAGATHFLNPVIVRQRRGGSLPAWAQGDGKPIGRHTFYSPDEGGSKRDQAVLSMSALGDSLPCGGAEDKSAKPQLETDQIFNQVAIR